MEKNKEKHIPGRYKTTKEEKIHCEISSNTNFKTCFFFKKTFLKNLFNIVKCVTYATVGLKPKPKFLC